MKSMNNFPENFTWESATSSYQIEGAADEAGKGPSIWDAFCTVPGRVAKGDRGDRACDHYHRMSEDVALMKAMGLKAYRFSIAWPRIMPSGKGQVNTEGLQFYDDLINELLDHGIEPWVTLYHWDLPLALQMEEDGWLNGEIADYFESYARVCFARFGDRVKHWITLNEPWVVAILGYGMGTFAPGRTSKSEPYVVGHNLLRAHAQAVRCYREEFQGQQKGVIGITNNCDWREPLTDKKEDVAAAERALEFFLAWFADPIYLGQYPKSMVDRLGDRLPQFTEEERDLLMGSSDFFGLNHYTTLFAADARGNLQVGSVYGNGGLSEDQDVNLSVDPNWKKTAMGWAVVPWGCQKLLAWISDRYDAPDIYITENGCAYADAPTEGKVQDDERIAYYEGYLNACHEAIEKGAQLKGYFAWSLLDNFEWASGYDKRFGLHYVDFDTLERIPKASADWYKKVIEANGIKDK
jgi:beta-galactosidase